MKFVAKKFMYSTSQIHDLQDLTNYLLNNAGTAEQLRDVLRFHEYRYYVLNEPLITDTEYDQLYKKLEKFEKYLWIGNDFATGTDKGSMKIEHYVDEENDIDDSIHHQEKNILASFILKGDVVRDHNGCVES